MKRTLPAFILLAIIFQLACNSDKSKSKPASSSATLEEISFKSQHVTLFGTIILPPEKDIVAAVVFVHGPGREGRDVQLAKKFAKEGIATLVYDKRGAGVSEGTYEEFCNEEQLDLLAEDAVAAVKLLSRHEMLKDKPIGLVGFSQAGWIIPLAAEKTNSVKFMGLWSGPVAKLSEERIFSVYTSDRDFKDVPTYEEVIKMRKQVNKWPAALGEDLNPAESLESLKIPGFWIFGKNDGNIPVDISVARLQQLKNTGWKYEYVIFPGKGHDLVNETMTTMTGWIKRVNDPAALTEWIKETNASAAMAGSNPISSDNLARYAGTYVRKSPPFMVTVREKDKKLIATGNGKPVELKQTDSASFYYNDYGAGYMFFDFDVERGRLLLVQNSEAMSLDKKAGK